MQFIFEEDTDNVFGIGLKFEANDEILRCGVLMPAQPTIQDIKEALGRIQLAYNNHHLCTRGEEMLSGSAKEQRTLSLLTTQSPNDHAPTTR